MNSTTRAHAPRRPAFAALVIALACLGAAARLAACFNDLWLDEIWTYDTASRLASPLDILTRVRHSNNNHLNTLTFYVLGAQDNLALYRIPSLLAGLGSIALAAAIARRFGRLEALLAVALASSSYLLIHYSSEARGYSSAVLFALLGLYSLMRYAEGPAWSRALLFWVAVVLGFLSHLEFVHFYSAAGLWSLWHFARHRRSGWSACGELLRLHAVPAAFVALLYLVDVRHMEIDGAPPYDLAQVLAETASYTLGGPPRGYAARAVGALAVGLTLVSMFLVWRRGNDLWALFAIVIFLSPGAVLIALAPEVLFVRYFLIGSAFSLLLASVLLATLARSGVRGRWAAGVLLLFYLCGNAWHTTALLRFGRGQYRAALRHVEGRSAGMHVTIGSDQDFRNGNVVNFYARTLDHPERLTYVGEGSLRQGPVWLLVHRFDDLGTPYELVKDMLGNLYRLEKVFPTSALSGWHWILYLNQTAELPSTADG